MSTTTPRGSGAECRKFAPNIFNKSKCSSCFKQKEEHSAEALECNRATRKISKCGYLFVAPGWDFSNPLNRTKRWQRRWFVLYDDGELTYSVDEHPETVPQSRIDMTRVLEVAAAEDVTGHPYSLAITSPEGVTFVKGTCREETRWWADVLQVYSRNKGRHKRNATFPGGQTTILQVTPTIRSKTPNPPRPRFNSCRSEPRGSWKPEANSQELCNSSFVGVTTNTSVTTQNNTSASKMVNNDGPLTSEITNENGSSVNCVNENGNANARTTRDLQISPLRNVLLENGNGHLSLNGTAQNSTNLENSNNSTIHNVSGNSSSPLLVGSEKPPMVPNDGRPYRDQPASSASPPTRDKLRAEDKARRRLNQTTQNPQRDDRTSSIGIVESNEKLDDDACRRILLEHEREREGKLRDIAASLTQPRIRRNKSRTSEPTRDVVDAANAAHQDKLVRGDPDGCGLDISGTRYSPTSELRVDLPAEDLLNIKKGWLMKQGLNKEWNKHWFVLRGCGLMYYRDPSTEDKGIMDGVIDLNTVTAVTPVQVARNYGFQTVTWDDRGTTLLSAVTAGIRSSWMSAIRRAANLPDPIENPVDGGHVACQNNQADPKRQSPTVCERERDPGAPTTPLTPRSVLFSSDEEYRTASEGGRRESGDWSEIPVSPPPPPSLSNRNGDWSLSLKSPTEWTENVTNHEWSELPPSPPLTRTALSRVKARSRSSSRSRVYKRSRSSPPNSRRSTLDSVRSEDLMMACCELAEPHEGSVNDGVVSSNESNDCPTNENEHPIIVGLLESQVSNMLRDKLDHSHHPSALLVIIERQENEIEALKSQLQITRDEARETENEILRLREHRNESNARDRKNDQDDYERMKKILTLERDGLEAKLRDNENILRETRERCEFFNNEISSSQRNTDIMRAEIEALGQKLAQGIEENERLYNRVRELEGKSSLSASRERGRSFDSLSDLTNIDLELDISGFDKERMMEEFEELRGRFEKAVLEIRAMRKELREAHATQDALELEIFAHKQDESRVNKSNRAQVELMAARIQDLTSKLGTSEKQVRTLKQKLMKVETRDKRRSLSLKGRESFQISQELEDKLAELETKICTMIESGGKCAVTPGHISLSQTSNETSTSPRRERKRENRSLDRGSRLRRKSLDSATSSEPMKVLIRLSSLETKVAQVAETLGSDVEKDSSECSEPSSPSDCQISTEILTRLRKLERALAKSKRRLEKCLGSTQAEEKAEKCLRDVNDILETCVDCRRNQQPSSQTIESVRVVVAKLEALLTEKITELTKKRQRLAANNQLDERTKLELVAERLAYETVVLRRMKASLSRGYEKNILLGELLETSHLISNLKSKVYGTKPKKYQNTSYVQYLTKILANKLVLVGGVLRDSNDDASSSRDVETADKKDASARRNDYRDYLTSKQRQVNEIMKHYKETKLRELADVLATETLSLSEQEDFGKQLPSNKLLEDRRIREAWAMAQETVNKELVQAEVSHVLTQCGQMYEQNITTITDTCLNCHESTSLETRIDETHARLRHQMESTIRELTLAYEDSLNSMKSMKNRTTTRQYDSRQLLNDYADVVAQKALIDARITLLDGEGSTSTEDDEGKTAKTNCDGEKSFVSSLIKYEDVLADFSNDNDSVASDPLLDAEFAYLYRRFANDCDEIITGKQRNKDELRTVVQSLHSLDEDVAILVKCLLQRDDNLQDIASSFPSNSSPLSDWSDVSQKCSDIRERLKLLVESAKNMQCKQCSVMQESIKRMSIQHAEEIEKTRKNQEKEILEIKAEMKNERESLSSQYEKEAASLRDRARKLEHRLNAMDSEHSAHVNELRAAYQRSISAELDTDAETRKRYKEEIKQLRGLCEKGLLAMENSHRRIIAEMEEKHRQELENLRIEKEQALSEETQATLAALDAMRKAHEHEVQKEIAKFKAEFIKQMQAREDIGALHKEHEEEMEEIKQEILSLSSKYSSKCVESAALEEKVGSLTKQMTQAQQHIMQLDARNKQLRAHLVLETNDTGINDTIQLLRGRDNEIAEQREEIHRLQQQLKHGDKVREKAWCDLTKNQSSLSHLSTSLLDRNPSKSNNETAKATLQDTNVSVDSSKTSPTSSNLRKTISEEKTSRKNNFSYKLERLRSISLPYTNSRQLNVKNEDNDNKNGMRSPLWDSLRPRTGLPHQYQGCSTSMRVRKPGIQWQEDEQSEKQQRQKAHTIDTNPRNTSGLTPEPSALSVAELMRSPSVRWSGRGCRSLPSTPTPGYHNSLYPPLPAVGMVAERKKRFEL
ncbi:protein outspread isoform X2 [Venturia canescens]|uniref:protein outspread isoform X2 n=1 Tax=Venturia canescens TaxID=32260 RepID=UPI001C9CAB4F|nr:protein outspread isoform X2 [Venturia canescens]